MIYLLLFVEFFKVGLFAIGGGLATLPFLYDLADKYHWFTAETIGNMIAVSESTPGPIGVNMATYAGFTTAGVPGALCATLGLVTPSIIVILVIAKFLTKFQDNPHVKDVFYGLRPAVTAMITVVVIQLVLQTFFGTDDIFALSLGGLQLPSIALFCVLVLAMLKIKAHPLYFLAASAAAGMLLKL